jgi:lysophospholipase
MAMISSFDGTKLYLNKEVSDGSTCVAVIVHGLCEHQGRYDYLADLFHKSGIDTYRFDHRGHGRSEGENAH